MKKGKLIKTIIAGALITSTITFGVLAGIKTSKTVAYSNEASSYTLKINELMKNDLDYEYNKPGTANYLQIKEWNALRKEANAKYNEEEKNLTLFASIAFISLFGLIYLGVDSLRRK